MDVYSAAIRRLHGPGIAWEHLDADERAEIEEEVDAEFEKYDMLEGYDWKE